MTRCHLSALLATSIVLGLPVNSATAQNRPPQLVLGESVERSLAAGERHAYSVWLDAGHFLFATVDQHGIDVYLSILDTNGNVVATGEGQRGMHGLEHVSFFPDTSGVFWLAILPRSERATPGSYSITLENLEPAATNPGDRVDQVFAAWDRLGSPGAAVAVVQNGEIVHANGYGSAQLEYGIPIEPTTAFHMASVSKQFTAFAVAMLAAEGRLSLDDDIRTYVPELYDYGHTITIRHLLYHTSGLRDQWSLLTMAGWRMDDVITRDQIFRLVERQRGLNFKPGDEYLYTNTGFTLLAEIVERVTGQTFRDWTAEQIFAPLGMTNTHFHDDHQAIVPNRAYSYQHDPAGGYKKSVLSYANVGATSLFSTIEDLSKWIANFETGEVGGPGLIRLLRSRGVLNSGDSLDYAMGQAIGSYRGLLALYHAGADAGFRTYLLRFPHQRLSVAVLSNLGAIDAGALSRQVAELYLKDQFVIAQDDQSSDSVLMTDPSVFGEYLGDYDLGPGMVMAISQDGDQLVANATDQRQVNLVPLSADRYVVEGSQQHIQFGRDTYGTVAELRVEETGSSVTAPRVEPFDSESVQISDYAGAFFADELGTTYTLSVESDTLYATHLRFGSITLYPSGPDAFVTNQWFIREVAFERNDAGDISGFRASNVRVRGLLFEKR